MATVKFTLFSIELGGEKPEEKKKEVTSETKPQNVTMPPVVTPKLPDPRKHYFGTGQYV